MAFPLGGDVVITRLQKKGRIVEVANGRYRVAVGSLTIWCDEAELSSVSHAKRQARHARATPPPVEPEPAAFTHVPTGSEARSLRSLDLHGMTVDEALHAVEVRLDRAIRAGLDRVEIIHGISGGRLRAAVRSYLAGLTSIAGFSADPRNAGVTWVYL